VQKIHKLNTTHKKQTTQNTANQNYPDLVISTTLGQEWKRGGLILYNDPEPTQGGC